MEQTWNGCGTVVKLSASDGQIGSRFKEKSPTPDWSPPFSKPEEQERK
jgi:hypothetical protein